MVTVMKINSKIFTWRRWEVETTNQLHLSWKSQYFFNIIMPDGTLVLPLHQPQTISDLKLFHTLSTVCTWHRLTPACLQLWRKVSNKFHSHIMKTLTRLWEGDFENSLKCSTVTGSKKLVQW